MAQTGGGPGEQCCMKMPLPRTQRTLHCLKYKTNSILSQLQGCRRARVTQQSHPQLVVLSATPFNFLNKTACPSPLLFPLLECSSLSSWIDWFPLQDQILPGHVIFRKSCSLAPYQVAFSGLIMALWARTLFLLLFCFCFFIHSISFAHERYMNTEGMSVP